MKGHPLHIQSRGKKDVHHYLISLNKWLHFTAGHTRSRKLTPRLIEISFGMCLPVYKGGLAASLPQLPPQLEYHTPVVALGGQQQASMCNNCLKGGLKHVIKACDQKQDRNVVMRHPQVMKHWVCRQLLNKS